MSPRTRFFLIAAIAFVLSCGLILLTAYTVGADPLHPRSRHIWALSLIAALYASIRIAMILGRLIDAYSKTGEGKQMPFGFLGKKEHAIDRRMAERRARVEAAKAKQTEPPSDPDSQ